MGMAQVSTAHNFTRLLPEIALGLIILFIVIFSQVFYWPQIADDSFIFYRYAQNMALGHGPVWNVNERPVEGYSSPLWVFVLSLFTLSGIEILSLSKILGVILFFSSLLAAYLLVRLISTSRLWGLLCVAIIGLSRPLQYWAPSGMETPLYVALLAWSMYFLVSDHRWAACLTLAGTGLCRPEGPFLTAGILGIYYLQSPALDRRQRAKMAALALVPIFAYVVFRFLYFRDIFPNTYYAKAGGSIYVRLRVGAGYARSVWLVLLSSAVASLTLIRRGTAARKHGASFVLILVTACLLIFVIVWGGGDWMWNYRLLSPVIFLIICLVMILTTEMLNGRTADGSELPAFAMAAILWISLGMLLYGTKTIRFQDLMAGSRGQHISYGEIQEGTMVAASRNVGLYLKEHCPDGALIAVNHAGALPYYSNLSTLDMTGLNDHHIAHNVSGGLHQKYDAGYVLERRPDYIVLNSRIRPGPEAWYWPGYWEGETALVAHPDFRKYYKFIPRYWVWNWFIKENFILLAKRHPG